MTIPGTADTSKQPGRGEGAMGQGIEEKSLAEAGFGPQFSLQALISRLTHDWVLLGCIVLTGTLCFGLGLLLSRENATPKDSLWIEQLPASVMPGTAGTSTSSVGESAGATTGISTGSVQTPVPQPAAAAAAIPLTTGTYMASKTGSKYYLPSCGSAKRIKEENRVWFATKQQAEAAGYEPATNCKGL